MDLFVAGRDQSAADQPNNLAEGHPQLWPLYADDLSLTSSDHNDELQTMCN